MFFFRGVTFIFQQAPLKYININYILHEY